MFSPRHLWITAACFHWDISNEYPQHVGGGRVWQRCLVSNVTGVSNWYWLTVGQGLLSLQQVRVEGECFISSVLHFHSCSSFFTVPLFHLFYYLFYFFSPFLWETTQNDPQGLMCLNTNIIKPTTCFCWERKKLTLKKSALSAALHDSVKILFLSGMVHFNLFIIRFIITRFWI